MPIQPWSYPSMAGYYQRLLGALAESLDFDIDAPWRTSLKKIQDTVLNGRGFSHRQVSESLRSRPFVHTTGGEGVVAFIPAPPPGGPTLTRAVTASLTTCEVPCLDCHGARLKPLSLAVTIAGKSIAEVAAMPIGHCLDFLEIKLSKRDLTIAERVLKEVNERPAFPRRRGPHHLTLDRAAGTLAGGEAQRIRLATQIGSGLVGVLYVLDEPSIGLHQRDNRRLIETLIRLRDLGQHPHRC